MSLIKKTENFRGRKWAIHLNSRGRENVGLRRHLGLGQEVWDVERGGRLQTDRRRSIHRQLERKSGHGGHDDAPVKEDAGAPEVNVISVPGLSKEAARPEGQLGNNWEGDLLMSSWVYDTDKFWFVLIDMTKRYLVSRDVEVVSCCVQLGNSLRGRFVNEFLSLWYRQILICVDRHDQEIFSIKRCGSGKLLCSIGKLIESTICFW